MPNYDTFKSIFAGSLIIILLPLWMVLQNRPSQNNGITKNKLKEGTKFNFTLPHAINNLPSNQKLTMSTLIIVFTDISYLSATKKWISRMEKLGYRNVRIYALEKLAFKELKRLNLTYDVQYHNTEYEIGLKPRNKADISESYKDPERKLRVKKGDRYKIWRIRLEVTKRILKDEGLSVVISDIDSIWTKYVDLEHDCFNGFDVIHSLGYKMPEWILQKQGFVLCGCFVYYKNTPNTLKFIEAYNYACKTTLCDDQILLNELYFKNNVSWTNATTNQTNKTKGPIKKYKTGILESNLRTSRSHTRDVLLQILVVSEEDIKRGGTAGPEDCENTWIMNPVLKLRRRLTDNSTIRKKYKHSPYKKLEIFEDFESC